MASKVVIFLGANYLGNYDFKQLKSDNIKFILVCGEYSFNKLNEYAKDFFYKIEVVDILPFEDKSVELFNYQSLSNVLEQLLQYYPNLCVYSDDEKLLLLAAKLREDFNIVGDKLADVLPFRDKTLMKKNVAAHNIRVPKYDHLDMERLSSDSNYFAHLVDVFNVPFIVKPIDLAGSYGVVIIKDEAQFDYLRQHIDTRVNYEVEEYIDGILYHYDAVIDQNCDLIFEEACQYFAPCAEILSGATLGSTILSEGDKIKLKICAFGQNLIKKLNLKGTAIHLELFETDLSELVFLEIAIRPAGAHVPLLYNQAFNISIFNMHCQVKLGIACSNNKKNHYKYYASGYIPTKKGRVVEITPPNVLSNFEIKYLIKENDMLDAPFAVGSHVGYFFCSSNTLTEFNQDVENLRSCMFYVSTP